MAKAVQKEAFQKEVALLKAVESSQDRAAHILKTGAMEKISPIRRLDPFMDQGGILRDGDSIRHVDLSYNEKHPLILPKKGRITELVIRYNNTMNCHQGHSITHVGICSSGAWII